MGKSYQAFEFLGWDVNKSREPLAERGSIPVHAWAFWLSLLSRWESTWSAADPQSTAC